MTPRIPETRATKGDTARHPKATVAEKDETTTDFTPQYLSCEYHVTVTTWDCLVQCCLQELPREIVKLIRHQVKRDTECSCTMDFSGVYCAQIVAYAPRRWLMRL